MDARLGRFYTDAVLTIREKGWCQQAVSQVAKYKQHTVRALALATGLYSAYKCYQKPAEALAMAAFGATWALLHHAIPQFAKDVLKNQYIPGVIRAPSFSGNIATSYTVLSFVAALKAEQRVCPSFDKVAVFAAFVLTEFVLVPTAKLAIDDHFHRDFEDDFPTDQYPSAAHYRRDSEDDFQSDQHPDGDRFASSSSVESSLVTMSSRVLPSKPIDISQIDILYLNSNIPLKDYHEVFPLGTQLILSDGRKYFGVNRQYAQEWTSAAKDQARYAPCHSNAVDDHKLRQVAHLLPLETVVVFPKGQGSFQLKSWDRWLGSWVRVERSH